ncbi:YcaO-like family protein [Desulfatiglans anilini]|uniref:YcaO-like family protein n=1 Tax=Desulfatiglans anilini TaxID=90728 RepID=UPI0003FACD20|nr:YcaO-like family protein [Desulfatiglans anilini]
MPYTITLKDAYKHFTLDQDKVLTPEETVGRFRRKLASLDLDILAETVRIDNGRIGIPVYFSVCGRDAEAVTGTRKQMGKGGTPQQAEASAVMELAERFSFFSFCRDDAHFTLDCWDNLKERAVPLEMIARSVHDTSEDVDKALEIFARLPLRWTWGYNLTRKEAVLIPFDWFFAINEFNGTSAGNCVEEALLQGLCEVVERHVSSLVSRGRLRVPAIDLDTARDPLVREMLAKYRAVGIELVASDFSLNTGIPTVGVLAYDPATFPHRSEIVWTAGTTPDPEKALSRALTEVAQLGGDFDTGSNYVASGLPKFRTLDEAAFIRKAGGTVGLCDLPNLSDANIRVEVENCVDALAGRGMEVLVIDVIHPRLGVPAFYTIIPGAHFRERAAGTSVGMFTAKIMAEKGDPFRALGGLDRMEKALPGRYYVHFYKGMAYLESGRHPEALEAFERALGRDPKEEDIPTILVYAAVCLKELGRYSESIAAARRAEGYDPERTDVFNLMGFCYFKLREHEKAIACFERSIELDPSSAIDYANIASNYRDMGDRERAIHYYRLALEIDPGIGFARENLDRLTMGKTGGGSGPNGHGG